MKKDSFLTAQEAADILKVNIMTIYRYINSKQLPAYKIGKQFRIENSDFETFIKSRKK